MKFDPFHIIRRPIMTEKTHLIGEEAKRYVFEVDPRATKTQIKMAVSLLFGSDVKVKKVNTINVKPKARRVFGQAGRKIGATASYKKAIITLTGDSKELDLF